METEMSSAWHHKATVRRSRELSLSLTLTLTLRCMCTVPSQTNCTAGCSVSDFSLSNQVPLLYHCSTYVQCVVVSSPHRSSSHVHCRLSPADRPVVAIARAITITSVIGWIHPSIQHDTVSFCCRYFNQLKYKTFYGRPYLHYGRMCEQTVQLRVSFAMCAQYIYIYHFIVGVRTQMSLDR